MTATATQATAFQVSDWKAMTKNTLRAFFTLTLPSGLRIRECMLHESNGKRWVGLPAKPWTKQDGSISYVAILDFATDAARDKFQTLALAAVDSIPKERQS